VVSAEMAAEIVVTVVMAAGKVVDVVKLQKVIVVDDL
jgi:hypothetical protein